MKLTDTFSVKVFSAFALGVLLLGSAGCVKNTNPDPQPGGGDTENLPVFDFATRATYTLNVAYTVPQGYQVYFEVYAENPFTTDANGLQVKKSGLEPVDKGYTDVSGKYSHKISLPTAVQMLYIYTPNVGVPQLLTAKVEGATLTASLPARASAANTKGAVTRAGIMNNSYTYPNINTILFGKWENYIDGYASLPNIPSSILYGGKAKIWGRPDYLTYVDQANFTGGEAALNIDAAILKTINTVLPGEKYGDPDPDALKTGDIHVTKDAEIDLYLLDDQCLYMNVLAYYCYPTNQPPTSAADIKTQVIALPNAKIIRSHNTYFTGTDVLDYGALRPGEGVRLHYIDPAGNDKGTTFPQGTSIGWILYSNGYSRFGSIGVGEGAIYSDKNLMQGIPHTAVFRHGDFVVTTFEDGRKFNTSDVRDFKDVLFHVGSSPADAITPGVPDKDPEKPTDVEVTYRGILSFEDNWPAQGDFDMNDVVVGYVSKVKYNANNEVVSTVDKYTMLWSGATFDNSFAVQNPNLNSAPVFTDDALKYGSQIDPTDGTIIRLAPSVLAYANKSTKSVFGVETTYANVIGKDNFVKPPYNPFITVKGDVAKEVHLTNMKPTAYADQSLFGLGKDKSKPTEGKYYITFDDNKTQMPFAIDVAFDSDAEMATYVIPKEAKHINSYYPGFMKWVTSGGADSKDWYLHPVEK